MRQRIYVCTCIEWSYSQIVFLFSVSSVTYLQNGPFSPSIIANLVVALDDDDDDDDVTPPPLLLLVLLLLLFADTNRSDNSSL